MQATYIKVGQRHRQDLGSLDDLVASIRDVGLLHPLVVDGHGNLIAGERRLAACIRLGWRDIPATIVRLDEAQVLRAEHDENSVRKNFTPSEMVAVKRAIEDRVRTPKHIHTDHPDRQSLPVSDGKTIDKAAAIVGTSGETLRKAEAVISAAEADPTLAPVVEEMDRTGKVDPAYQKVKAEAAAKSSQAAAKRQATIADKSEAEVCRTALTKLRTQYKHLAYWQPVWDAVDSLNGVTR
jgi:ParB family chromosome partitioning protein